MDINVKEIKSRFMAINRERLNRARETLSWRQRDFLDLLPIFFHLNHPTLPGFVSRNTPSGIPQYSPSAQGLRALKSISKSFKYQKRAQAVYDILSIFLMGSAGTIAYSKNSDFDIWLCHRSDISVEEKRELREKCSAIEVWASSLSLEVHIFLINPAEFRNGEVTELSSESSGSAQYHLLLEEFYRTSMLLAGRYPIWWLVPPSEESNYDQCVETLITNKFVPENDVVILGGLSHLPAEEFFGAALWQLYKGIDSPYKSVLKIMLMEAYAENFPDSQLLSWDYKQMIYNGETDVDILDPYSILLKKLETYLVQRQEYARLELVRRCFYFKVKIPLSKPGDDWRRSRLAQLVKEWRWSQAQISLLDQRSNWKIHQVLGERRVLVDELTQSYLALSKFVREKINLSSISQKDLNILGRKLYAAFERKAGKIELVNRGVSANVFERKLTLRQVVGKDGSQSWALINESTSLAQDTMVATLKRGHSALELLAWCHFNRLIDHATMIILDAPQGVLDIREVKAILESLGQMVPGGWVPKVAMEDYGKPPAIKTGGLFVNVGQDPLAAHSKLGADIISDKSDVLNYSGFSFNLALSFDLLFINSWQEVLTYRYTGDNSLMNCLCEYLRLHRYSPDPVAFKLSVFSFSSAHSFAIANRLEKLFADVVLAFYHGGRPQKVRYVLEVEKAFYLLRMDGDGYTYEKAVTPAEMYELLSKPQLEYVPIVLDSSTLSDTAFPALLKKNKKNRVQLFYEPAQDSVNVYVLDHHGSVFYQVMPYHDDFALLNQFTLFFESLAKRCHGGANDGLGVALQEPEFCRVDLVPDYGKGYKAQFERKLVRPDNTKRSYFHVQVIGEVVEQKTNFTIYCNNKEFSSWDHGMQLFEKVALTVYLLRQSGEKYPIYITDLDLSPELLEGENSGGVQLIEYLRYKERIENKLNQALAEL
ncbi:MAG: class I adenylate cyclase [Gammaproteobacteria bacterium]|nr:class I adenylate cyclase [Gammaproteobacteria bacterium]MDH5803264.1 class I adenylate cyclase [Gammaproteobacteria bacterium]